MGGKGAPEKEATMKTIRNGIWMAAVAVALAAAVAGCSPGQEQEVRQAQARQEVAAGEGRVQQAPWMAGERWGMTPGEVAALMAAAPALQSESSDYYLVELEGRPALSQYVFGKGEKDGERKLVRKIVYLANPKRAAYLPLLPLDDAKAAFEATKASLERTCGTAQKEVLPMAVSAKLESQARVMGDRVAAAEKEVRAMERDLELRRRELQKQYAGQKNRNALVASGLVEMERPLQKAQWKLQSLKGELGQVRQAIRQECEALPEKERPFQWRSEWTAADGSAALYLTVNARGTFLSASFWAPE
jgi:hypothetical protein